MSIQLVIIIAYFAISVLVGLLMSRGTNSASIFHGTQLGVAAIVCASAGEWLGGTATTGVSEYGFLYGLSGAWYTIANGLGVLFLGLFFAKLYRSIGKMTVPGIIEHIFGKKAQVISSLILVFVMIAVGMSQVIAAGKFGQALLGIDFTVTALVFTLIFISYTWFGGMKAVSATNTVHLFVMYGGVIAAVMLLIQKVGGWEGFLAGVRDVEAAHGGSYLSMTSIGFPKISSWVIASLLGACTAQAGIQPVLASKDIPTARKACIYTAMVTAPFGLFTAMIGLIARILSNQGSLLDKTGSVLTDGKMALTSIMMSLPPLVGGLVLAAELAAILSTASPIILAAGTLITKDYYQVKVNPRADDRDILRVSKITTALSGVVCCIGAIALVEKNNVLDLVYAAYSIRGALFIVLIFGFFWNKANEKGACVSMIVTTVVAVCWVGFKLAFGHYPFAPWFTETYAAVLTAAITMILASLKYQSNRIDGRR